MAQSGNAVRAMLQAEGTYATTLLVWALDTIGPDLYTWHPATIKHEVERRGGCQIRRANFDKLMTAIAIVTTDMFFKDVTRFIPMANVLAGDDFQSDEFDPADTVECAWAITEALLLTFDPQAPEEFSDDICHYISFILREEGFIYAPDVLKIATRHDQRPTINSDFSDDPEMFSAMYKNQDVKTEEVETIIRQGLAELFAQLESLPLEQGSVNELRKKMRQPGIGSAVDRNKQTNQ